MCIYSSHVTQISILECLPHNAFEVRLFYKLQGSLDSIGSCGRKVGIG